MGFSYSKEGMFSGIGEIIVKDYIVKFKTNNANGEKITNYLSQLQKAINRRELILTNKTLGNNGEIFYSIEGSKRQEEIRHSGTLIVSKNGQIVLPQKLNLIGEQSIDTLSSGRYMGTIEASENGDIAYIRIREDNGIRYFNT